MKKNKKAFAAAVLVLAALALAYLSRVPEGSKDDAVLLFYGYSCPHCKNVEKFIDENGLNSKMNIVSLEVMNNSGNLAQMRNYAAKCGLKGGTLSVPFIVAQGRCYEGEENALKFLKTRGGL